MNYGKERNKRLQWDESLNLKPLRRSPKDKSSRIFITAAFLALLIFPSVSLGCFLQTNELENTNHLLIIVDAGKNDLFSPELSALAKCNAKEELESGNLNNELVNVPLTPLFCRGKWKPMCICFPMCCRSVCPLPPFSIIRTILGYETAIDIKKKCLELHSQADMLFIIIRNIEIISSFQISTSLGVNSFCLSE